MSDEKRKEEEYKALVFCKRCQYFNSTANDTGCTSEGRWLSKYCVYDAEEVKEYDPIWGLLTVRYTYVKDCYKKNSDFHCKHYENMHLKGGRVPEKDD